MKTLFILLASGLVLSLTLSSKADTLVLCVGKGYLKTVRYRGGEPGSCKRYEEELPIEFGQGPPGPEGPQGATGPQGPAGSSCSVNTICSEPNTLSTLSCPDDTSVTWETPLCGNGCLDSEEECDDGNTDEGDGCDPVCKLEGPIDAERQVETIEVMTNIVTLNEAFFADFNEYAPSLSELGTMTTDGWGNPLIYETNANRTTYLLKSLGSDGEIGPDPPDPWPGPPFEPDIALDTGVFIQKPE